MNVNKLFEKMRKPSLNLLKALGIIAVLSLIIDVCTLFMTVLPFDLKLIAILLLDIRIVILNFLPLFFLMTLIFFIFGSMRAGFIVTGLVAFSIAQINIYTMTFRDMPFSFADIKLAVEASEMAKSYTLFLGAISIMVLAVLVLTAIFLWKKVPRIKTGWIIRICGTVLCAVLVIAVGNRFYRDGSGGYKIYESTWHPQFGNEYKTSNQNMSRGVIYCFARSVYEAEPQPPFAYDEEAAKQLLSKYEETPTEEDKKVHIISIMLEAYNDFSKFPGIELELSPYEHMHALQKDGYSGLLYTNIFAGNTIVTERSFLTGFGSYEYKKNTASFVRYLKSQGYYTEAMHAGYGWFYNRKNVFNYLGFDNFHCHESAFSGLSDDELTAYRYHGLISDLDFFDYITKSFEQSVDRGEKYFGFGVTYQNHGPYPTEPATDKVCLVKKDSYSEEAYHSLNNYLSEIYRTDLAIGQLREYVDNSSEPIVVVLFGDHNPSLGEGTSGYTALGIDVDTSTPAGSENYYGTPYVFYANDAAKKALGTEMKGEGPDLSPIFLMKELFEQMGFGGSRYMNYMGEAKEKYNVLGTEYVQSDGEYIYRLNVWNDQKILERQWVEYYLRDKGIAKDGFSLVK